MNDFFHTKRIIVLAVFVFIVAAYITLRYVRLALTPVAEITPRTPVMERGAIVDRSGKTACGTDEFLSRRRNAENGRRRRFFCKRRRIDP